MASVKDIIRAFSCHTKGSCDGCPYIDSYNNYSCIRKSMSDALKLLKENQPRIMRLPEAMSKFDPIIIEIKQSDGNSFVKWVDAVLGQNARCVTVVDLYCESTDSRECDFDFALYNKTFRFWSSKPTLEQRKSVPWESLW